MSNVVEFPQKTLSHLQELGERATFIMLLFAEGKDPGLIKMAMGDDGDDDSLQDPFALIGGLSILRDELLELHERFSDE